MSILEETGGTHNRNIYGINLIARNDGAGALYYLYNGHRDVVKLINASGSLVNEYDYDIFGNVLTVTEGKPNPYRYAGYYFDTETDYYYLNARYYDPNTARFITEDIYVGEYDDPLSLNLYTYCGNNPIYYFDPTGHWGEPWTLEGYSTPQEWLKIIKERDLKKERYLKLLAAYTTADSISTFKSTKSGYNPLSSLSAYDKVELYKLACKESDDPIIKSLFICNILPNSTQRLGEMLTASLKINLFYFLNSEAGADLNYSDADPFTVGLADAGANLISGYVQGSIVGGVVNSTIKISEGTSKSVPVKAQDIVNQVKAKNGAPPQGYKGGKTYNNQPVNGGQKLPDGVKYKEYDVNPYIKGQNRGAERVVIGDDGSAWYTNDHYHTFTRIK